MYVQVELRNVFALLLPNVPLSYFRRDIVPKSMPKNISIQRAKTSGNTKVSQTHLAIFTILLAFKKAIHLDLF